MSGTHEIDSLRSTVKERYAAAARHVVALDAASCSPPAAGSSGCCGATTASWDPITANLYDEAQTQGLPAEAVLASLGCGNPTALADLAPGETVLDLGSGGGIDVLLSARRVGPNGKAYGLDMTDEMLALANENKARAQATNVEFLRGTIEDIPLPSATVDVIISNCVINLSGDKRAALAEAFRVLKPGGRFAVSDVVVRGHPPEAVRRSMELWVGCVAGALEEQEFIHLLTDVGFVDVRIEPTRVYTADDARAFLAGTGLDASAMAAEIDGRFMGAFIRATKPAARPAHEHPATTVVRRATSADLAPVLALLREAALSIPGVEEHFADFMVAERDGRVIGALGLELRGTDALLRSAVVAPDARGHGVASALFNAVTALARDAGVRTLVLLTSSAEGYWARHGFRRIARDEAPASVKVSAEFTGACPETAACMRLTLS